MASIIVKGGDRFPVPYAWAARRTPPQADGGGAPGAGESLIRNVPDISDVGVMAQVLERLGARVTREDHCLHVDATNIASMEAPYELVAQMRASIVVLGPLLARFGHARVAMPGGCNIGSRKIDMHIHGLQHLGVQIDFEHGYIEASVPRGLTGAHVILDFPSVGRPRTC